MRTPIRLSLLALLLSPLAAPMLQAQLPVKTAAAAELQTIPFDGRQGTWVPEWQGMVPVSQPEDVQAMLQAPWCRDCSFDPTVVTLPVYTFLVPLEEGQEVEVRAEGLQVSNTAEGQHREAVAAAPARMQQEWYPASWAQKGEVQIHLGKRYQQVHLYPVRVSRDGSRLQRAGAVQYSISPVPGRAYSQSQPAANKRSYAANSVLASGSWYKLGVTQSGIYRLDYTFLSGLGIDMTSLDPRTLRIHGNGGGMLTQVAGAYSLDDVTENAIWVSGESDGTFDPSDYVLFYARGPHPLQWHSSQGMFLHQQNVYSDSAFYFLSYGSGPGKRVQVAAQAPGVNYTPTDMIQNVWHESDLKNIIYSGRTWLGESFDLTTSQNYSFPAGRLAPGTQITVMARLAASSSASSAFDITCDGTSLGNITLPVINPTVYGTYQYRTNWAKMSVSSAAVADGMIDLNLTYNKPGSSSVGYLDFLDVQMRSRMDLSGNSPLSFRFADNTGPGTVLGLNFTNVPPGTRLWDVTDPQNVREMTMTVNGTDMSTSVLGVRPVEFMSFGSSGFLTPVSGYALQNQNLHALDKADFVIVTHAQFLTAANRLADFHRNRLNQSVQVATVDEIYNEFSSGAQDPAAIRDFLKMFYDRHLASNEQPKWVLLLGDGSYDPKGRVSNSFANFIPTYQSRKSQRPTESYVSDDFYAFLDDGEGFWGEKAASEGGAGNDILYLLEGDTTTQNHTLDIALGRFPVGSVQEAEDMVSKVIDYSTNVNGFGTWRNRIVLVADHKDADGTTHISQADSYSGQIGNANSCYNVDKFYMDNYNMEVTAAGNLFPTGKEAMLNAFDEGSLIVNYTGHGGETGWSNSSILEVPDINSMNNGVRMPAYVTATCEFGRWDDPNRRSGAELLFIHPSNGAIAMFTTVRVVYSGPNYTLNQNFYDYALTRDAALNRMPTLGEIFRKTKNDSWQSGSINNRNFTLMGDPALSLNYPRYEAVITSINGRPVTAGVVDTLPPMTLVTITGEIHDEAGNFVSTYAGDMNVTVYDKPGKFTTKRAPFTFYWQKNRIFNGAVSISNGTFSIQFVVPIDISYESGTGKVSLYFTNNRSDGAGCDNEIFIGGSGSAISDNRGPEMDLYMNDETFVDGGLTSPDPVLLARVFDDNGINTVGSGVGHELTGVLDDVESDVLILNDFYSADKNSYQRGTIRFPFKDLEEGEHTLRVKVWDVANNSTEGTVRFVVADDASVALGHVLNYPNPFTTNTNFIVEHNQNGKALDVTIKIFSVSGQVVKVLEDSFYAEGNLYRELNWDGLDDYGDPIGRGVYVYQVTVRDPLSGEKAHKYEKLVVLR